MKKLLILGAILLLVVAVGCKPAAPSVDVDLDDSAPDTKATPAEEPESEPEPSAPAASSAPAPVADEPEPTVGRSEPSRPLPSERQQAETQAAPEPAKELSPKIRDLIKRKNDKLKSVQFLYGGSETGNLFLNTYLFKGDKAKVLKFSEDYYVQDGYYDVVYVHDNIACCEEPARCESHNVNNRNVSFTPSESDLSVPKTPMQWMDSIQSNAEVIGPQTIDERSVTYLVYEDAQGQEVHMWVDDTYGIPHKVEVRAGDDLVVKHQFNDVRFNQLSDDDFVAPCADLPRA